MNLLKTKYTYEKLNLRKLKISSGCLLRHLDRKRLGLFYSSQGLHRTYKTSSIITSMPAVQIAGAKWKQGAVKLKSNKPIKQQTESLTKGDFVLLCMSVPACSVRWILSAVVQSGVMAVAQQTTMWRHCWMTPSLSAAESATQWSVGRSRRHLLSSWCWPRSSSRQTFDWEGPTSATTCWTNLKCWPRSAWSSQLSSQTVSTHLSSLCASLADAPTFLAANTAPAHFNFHYFAILECKTSSNTYQQPVTYPSYKLPATASINDSFLSYSLTASTANENRFHP